MALTDLLHSAIHNYRHCLRLYIIPAVLSALAISCDSHSDTHSRPASRIDVDWSGFAINEPTGMTVLSHHAITNESTQTTDNNTGYVTPKLSPGRHWITVFNQTEEEYSNIRFRGLDNVETAEAYPEPLTGSKWYDVTEENNSYTAAQPEWLATDTILTDQVEPATDGLQPAIKTVGTLHPLNIIHTLHLTIHIDNIGNLRSARGAISGLASGRRLASESPNDNTVTVTHLIESADWTCRRSSSGSGVITADIRCFGLPANHAGTPPENRLELQALLADGKTVKKYDMAVGHLIDQSATSGRNRGDNLDLHLEIWLEPALPPCSGNGGIDVWLDDWNDRLDFNIPI